MEQKKIIFIINHYSSNSDQHLFHVMNLVKEIAQSGVKIALIFERCEGTPPSIHENVIIYGQKQTQILLRGLELFFAVNYFMNQGYRKVFIRISQNAAWISVICAKFYGGETYFWHSGTGFELIQNLPMDKARELEAGRRSLAKLGKKIDFFVTGPESMLNYYQKWCNIPQEKMRLLYNDVDITRFSLPTQIERENLRKELKLAKNNLYVLFVHRFSPVRKSLYYIPYCLKQFKSEDITFLMIGTGPEEKEVMSAVASAGMTNVMFLGSQPNVTIQKYYKACDIFINPTFCEGFPRVIIEAMACGMPIVTTNAGGTADLLGTSQHAYISDVIDRDAFAKNLSKMINSIQDRRLCSIENLDRVKRFSTNAVVHMYRNLFWPLEKKEF